MAVVTAQVTLGAGATQISVQSNLVKWVIFQNNAAAVMRIGDSNVSATRGISLSPGGAANPVPTAPVAQTNLKYWYVFGTATQILDVIYEDGQP